jgi:hypothetical protein
MHSRRPETGGVLRAYTACKQEPVAVEKSIANNYYLANVAGNPHTFEYRYNFDRKPLEAWGPLYLCFYVFLLSSETRLLRVWLWRTTHHWIQDVHLVSSADLPSGTTGNRWMS